MDKISLRHKMKRDKSSFSRQKQTLSSLNLVVFFLWCLNQRQSTTEVGMEVGAEVK